MPEHILTGTGNIIKAHHLFPLGNGNAARFLQQLPGGIGINTLLARVNRFDNLNPLGPKKLLGILAGRSALAQIGPIDLLHCSCLPL